MMTCTVPAAWPLKTLRGPPAATGTMALFPRVWPAEKLTVATRGNGAPAGKSRRWPTCVGSVTVTLRATAAAVAGTPHAPPTRNTRVDWAARAGAYAGSRVSTTRQGGSVKRRSPGTVTFVRAVAALLPGTRSVSAAAIAKGALRGPVVLAPTATVTVTIVDAEGRRAPSAHEKLCPAALQVGDGGSEETNVAPAGSVAVRVDPVEADGPRFVTCAVYTSDPPAVTGSGASASPRPR